MIYIALGHSYMSSCHAAHSGSTRPWYLYTTLLVSAQPIIISTRVAINATYTSLMTYGASSIATMINV